MEPNKFEQEVRAKMEQRLLNPTPMAWDRLDAMLSVAETRKPQRSYRWLYIAASMVLMLGAGLFFLNREAATTLPSGESSTVVATPESKTQAESTAATADTKLLPKISKENPVALSQKATFKKQPAKNILKEMKQPAIATQDEALAVRNPQAPSHEVQVTDNNKMTDAVADLSPNMTSGKVKVDSRALLSSVEGELDDSFRSKMLQSVTKNYNTVKTALVNRNHE